MKKAFAFTPVDQQVFRQKHRHHHPQAVVHPAGFEQLAHRGIDDRQACARFLPRGEFVRRVAPGQRFGFRAEGAMTLETRG
jgi:hypothetical protein